MKTSNISINENELYNLYVTEGMTVQRIANKLGVSRPTVLKWLKEYGIKARSMSEAKRMECPINKEELYNHYVTKGMTAKRIANKLGVSSSKVIRWLKGYGIKKDVIITKEELRNLYVTEGMTAKQIADKVGVSRPTVLKWLKEYGIKVRSSSEANRMECLINKEELRNLYVTEGMTAKQIADKVGVSHATVLKWLKGYGIGSIRL